MANKEGVEFTETIADFAKRVFKLCNETYKATKKPIGEADLKDLIARAEKEIREYETMLEAYSGARRESVMRAGSEIDSLREFTAALQRKLKKA